MAGAQAVNWTTVLTRVAQPTLYARTTDPYGPPGYPPLVSREQVERAVDLLQRGHLVEVSGNHMTGFFGASAAAVTGAITSFLRAG